MDCITDNVCSGDSLMVHQVKNLPAMQETWVPSLSWQHPLEEEMATHSSILTWKIPWTESKRIWNYWTTKQKQITDKVFLCNKLLHRLPKWLCHFVLPSVIIKNFCSFIFLLAIDIVFFIFFFFWMLVPPIGVQWNHIKTNDVEHCFVYLFANCIAVRWDNCSDILLF